MFKPCIIIPIYNHAALLNQCIDKITCHNTPIILVNDGSSADNAGVLQEITNKNNNITLLSLEYNQGKGAAMVAGFSLASKLGFSHALQIDADNQHNFSDIPLFLELSKSNQKSVINGLPIYDSSVPKARLYGRKITNFWVMIETFSRKIKDAMCGFRIYPLQEVINIAQKNNLSPRMGFDIEIIVRLYWQGLSIINQPTKVKYPLDGVSHFRMFHDNYRISLLHSKLFFGMLGRLPFLIKRKFYE